MAILGLTMFSNTLYAQICVTGTKDRIIKQEIKFEQKIDINKLIRNTENKIQINIENNIENKYERSTSTTSRGEVNRTNTKKIEQNYTQPKDVKISKNMDLTKRTGLSKKDFKRVIRNLKSDKSKFFYRNADTIYDLCEKYEINEIFFCGLMAAESGWNITSNHRSTCNYISLMKNGKLIRYSSERKGLEVAAKKLHKNYLTPGGKFYGGKTISGVQKRFCPSSTTWDDLVYGCMKYISEAAHKIK